jgi:hypothetical protein
MGWEAGIPAGFDERTTGFPEGHQIDLYAAGWRSPRSTPGRRPHSSRVEGGEDGRALSELRPVVARLG